jgi:hypothetical protein
MATPVHMRVMKRITKDVISGCWVWQGAKIPQRYGIIGDAGKSKYVHRVMYEHAVGQIPMGAHLHHVCKNPSCCNPEHLELRFACAHASEHSCAGEVTRTVLGNSDRLFWCLSR